ncbi:hypothetical protein NMY22_g13138 [Coprinellus aureogranulatus]|nr:hypothetical protein NMY22_g13138 [Coprinellus aureogranulatus]
MHDSAVHHFFLRNWACHLALAVEEGSGDDDAALLEFLLKPYELGEQKYFYSKVCIDGLKSDVERAVHAINIKFPSLLGPVVLRQRENRGGHFPTINNIVSYASSSRRAFILRMEVVIACITLTLLLGQEEAGLTLINILNILTYYSTGIPHDFRSAIMPAHELCRTHTISQWGLRFLPLEIQWCGRRDALWVLVELGGNSGERSPHATWKLTSTPASLKRTGHSELLGSNQRSSSAKVTNIEDCFSAVP